jgi:hypothetical protein
MDDKQELREQNNIYEVNIPVTATRDYSYSSSGSSREMALDFQAFYT